MEQMVIGISQRRAVQLGVLSAVAVFVLCLGVLISQGVEMGSSDSPTGAASSAVQPQQPPQQQPAPSDTFSLR
jgi:hypothetical protein